MSAVDLQRRCTHGGARHHSLNELQTEAEAPCCQQSMSTGSQQEEFDAQHTMRSCSYLPCILLVLQGWLHMPQLRPEFQAFAGLSAVLKANTTWGMCSKHCNTLVVLPSRMMQQGTPAFQILSHANSAGCGP